MSHISLVKRAATFLQMPSDIFNKLNLNSNLNSNLIFAKYFQVISCSIWFVVFYIDQEHTLINKSVVELSQNELQAKKNIETNSGYENALKRRSKL